MSIELSNGPEVVLDNSTEVGPVTISGPSTTGSSRLANGDVMLGEESEVNGEGSELNSDDGQPVEVSHIVLQGAGELGSLRTDDAAIEVGHVTMPAEGIRATSVRLDSASQVDFKIDASGDEAKQDYSQLASTGEVDLNGGNIFVSVHPPKVGAACPTFSRGETFEFITTSGPLVGAFGNAPEHGSEIEMNAGAGCPTPAQKMRIEYHESGSTQTVTGTIEAQAQEEQEAKEAREKQELKEDKEKLEAREREAALQVLGSKEGAPDATIASTSLQASASGALSVKVSCPTGVSSCTGTVTLRTLSAVIASAATKSKSSVLTLASGSFAVPGGGTRTVALRLSAKARALLARLHTVRARATIVARDPSGGTHTEQIVVTVHGPKHKHGKE